MLFYILCFKIEFFADVTTIRTEFKKKNSFLCPQFSSSHALALLHITTGGAQQPAVLTQLTVAVVMFSLFALKNKPNLRCSIPTSVFHKKF